jgi:hypothetical protein
MIATRFLLLAPLALLVACADSVGSDREGSVESKAQAQKPAAAWSTPVNLGAAINSAANDLNASLTNDGLSLYFTSTRPGGVGGEDIYVSGRECDTCAWGTPVNLGPSFNTKGNEGGVSISKDGHTMIFHRHVPPPVPAPVPLPVNVATQKLYITHRVDTNDNFAWDVPVELGADINTPGFDNAGPEYSNSEQKLYFGRRAHGVGGYRIHSVDVNHDFEAQGPVELVAELNVASLTIITTGTSINENAHELFFSSGRPGLGQNDIYTSTRQNKNEPWGAPVNLLGPVNTTFNDRQPSVSGDTMIFSSNRPGGLGGDDIWMSTRE